MSRLRKLADFYFSIDLRSLALFRILFAGTLIYDWMLRWPNLEAFYTSFGVLPIDAPLNRAGGMYHFSLLDGFVSLPMVQLFFLAGLVFYLGLLIGYRTKLFQILSCLFLISVLNRNTMIRTGGDFVLTTMSVWALFLPLGMRFSIDSLSRQLRTSRFPGKSASREDAGDVLCRPSLAAFGIVLQIALIYLMTAIDKHGPTWWAEGSAIYYAMHVDQFTTPLGKWCVHLPFRWSQGMTWAALGLEYAVAPLILLPCLQPMLRRVAIFGLIGLHLGTWATMHLGTFPFVMMSTYALLLLPADWQLLKRSLSRWSQPVTVTFDSRDAFIQRFVRTLHGLDQLDQIRFVPVEEKPARDHRLRQAIETWGWAACDGQTGTIAIGSDAVLQILAALPLPWHLFGILGLPGLAWVMEELCASVSRHRRFIARGFGWEPEIVADSAPTQTPGTPLFILIWRIVRMGTETLAAGFLLVCMFYGNYNDNVAPAWHNRRLREPALIHAFAFASQLVQDWNMFAPDPMRNDGWWVIEGETLSGKKIDPFTGEEPTWEKPAYVASQFDASWRKYLSRINLNSNRDHRLYFGRYLTRFNHREHNGADRLSRFRLIFVQERTQPPGSTEPFPTRRIELWQHDCFAASPAAERKSQGMQSRAQTLRLSASE